MKKEKAFHELDVNLKENLFRAYQHYEKAYSEGVKQFQRLQEGKEFIKKIRTFSLQRIPQLLEQFEKKFTSRGGKIHFAQEVEDVYKILNQIIQQSSLIVKSKSMVTEEIDLNRWLMEVKQSEVWETDLGEFIVQQMNQKPSHITAPAIHLSKEEIFAFFQKKYQTENSIESIVSFVRRFLREKFAKATIGITGSNFLIADVGAVAITENEANAGLTVSCPLVHIVITTPDKLIPSVHFLSFFWPILATHATGQQIAAYNHLIFGPATQDELNGPKEMHVILLDANRSEILQQDDFQSILTCIHCGACLTVCPVFQRAGGHAYASTYAGPMGSILTPLITKNNQMLELASVCTLCGLCSARCPAAIPLDRILLKIRHKQVKEKPNFFYKIGFKFLSKRKVVHAIPGVLKQVSFNLMFGNKWQKFHSPLLFSRKTFTRKR